MCLNSFLFSISFLVFILVPFSLHSGDTPDNFHVLIINDTVDNAYAKLKEVLAEQIKQVQDANAKLAGNQ